MRRRVSGYLIAEMKRMITGFKFPIGIAGTAMAVLFSLQNLTDMGSTIDALLYSTYCVGFMISFSFCALSGASTVSEDLEFRYVRYMIIRGKLRKYVWQKLVYCFFTALLTMVAGMFLFVFCFSIKFPLVNEEVFEILSVSGYFFLIQKEHFFVWILLYGIHWGIWAGCLAVAAAVFSLFISNKMLILAAPAFLHQIITELVSICPWEIPFLLPSNVFDVKNFLFRNNVKMAVWGWSVGGVWLLTCTLIACWKLKRRM